LLAKPKVFFSLFDKQPKTDIFEESTILDTKPRRRDFQSAQPFHVMSSIRPRLVPDEQRDMCRVARVWAKLTIKNRQSGVVGWNAFIAISIVII
jgi:hypothetical protein